MATRFAAKIDRRSTTASNQRGSTLLITLVFLSVLTILGLTSMQGTTLQERMAGNMSQRALAFQAAESALRMAEDYCDPVTYTFSGGEGGLHGPGDAPDVRSAGFFDPFDEALWTNSTADPATDAEVLEMDPIVAGHRAVPSFFIEELGEVPADPKHVEIGEPPVTAMMYRVVARGSVNNGNSVVLLEGYYSR